jgi:hypothetical protein
MTMPSDASIRTYISSLNSLAKDLGHQHQPEGWAWLSNAKSVWNTIDTSISNRGENISWATKSVRLFSIKYLLEAEEAPHAIWADYEPYVIEVKNELEKQYAENTKSANEAAQWMTLVELKKVLDDIEKQVPKRIDSSNPGGYRNLMKYLVLKFHLDTPIRNDLSDAKIYKDPRPEDIADESCNYIILDSANRTGEFIDNIYKTKARYGTLKFPLTQAMTEDLLQYYNILIVHSPDHWFITNIDGEQMTRNNFTKFVQGIFRPYGKNISTSMLRKIIRSDFECMTKEDFIIEQQSIELARIMGHTLGVAKKYYTKVID